MPKISRKKLSELIADEHRSSKMYQGFPLQISLALIVALVLCIWWSTTIPFIDRMIVPLLLLALGFNVYQAMKKVRLLQKEFSKKKHVKLNLSKSFKWTYTMFIMELLAIVLIVWTSILRASVIVLLVLIPVVYIARRDEKILLTKHRNDIDKLEYHLLKEAYRWASRILSLKN